MKPLSLLILFVLFLGPAAISPTIASPASSPIAIVIHGGAGTITRERLTPKKEQLIRAKLAEAANRGYQVLKKGGHSIDAVVAAIEVLENSPLFNAGKGAVYTSEGTHELDASLMRGDTLNAGAVAGVKHVKNPIFAARLVMEQSPHVMLAGEGADNFAKANGLVVVDNHYFDTQHRKQQLEKAQGRKLSIRQDPLQGDYKFGTVGAVALDSQGNIVAGTSTGGMTNKAWGRIGDSPVIGAGTWADNHSCGISATGHGEYFIRYAVAHDICSRVKYLKQPLLKAARSVIQDQLKKAGGSGGVIGIDQSGVPVMVFNTKGMYRAWRTPTMDKAATGIFDDEGKQ